MFAALEMPTIALVDGVCVGGSLGFALQCDVRIATDRARFWDAHIPNGIAPSAAVWFAPRLMTSGQALRFFCERRPVPAAEALRIGLIDEVVASDGDALGEAFLRIAEDLAACDPRLVRHTKALVTSSAGATYPDAMRLVGLFRAIERLERRNA